jgi:hypothetical protein
LLLVCHHGLLFNLIVSIRRNFLGHFSLDLGRTLVLDLQQLCPENLQRLFNDHALSLDFLECLVVLHDLFVVRDHLLLKRANISSDLFKSGFVLQ